METVVLSIHIILAVCLILLILPQQGKGADVGAVMGGGGANSLFGASGASNLLVKMTTGVAVAFMLTSVLLVRFAAGRAGMGRPADDPLRGSSLAGAVSSAAPSTGAGEVSVAPTGASVPGAPAAVVPPAEASPQAAAVAPQAAAPSQPSGETSQAGQTKSGDEAKKK